MSTTTRIGFAIVIGALASIVSLYLMQMMISRPQAIASLDYDYNVIDFVRVKRESEIETRDRILPKKPKTPPPPPEQPPKTSTMNEINPQAMEFDIPQASIQGLMEGPQLDGFNLGGIGTLSPNKVGSVLTPLVRIPPQYPRRAAMNGIEGKVHLEFTVTTSGTVTDVHISKSEPKGIFDRAAKRALLKWKFRPKLQDGKPIAYRANIPLVFKLDNQGR